MKLAILGVATLVVGLIQGTPGLAAVGGFWIVAGLLVRTLQQARNSSASASAPSTPIDGKAKTPPTGRTVALNTTVMLAVGLPSLAVGVLELGIDRQDAGWRWLPIAVGGLSTAVAVVAALMYLLGSGMSATADHVGVPELPATITIRAMRETGTYINDRPRLEFELLVTPDGMPPYQVTKRATVPFTAMGSLRVGAGFHAKVAGPDKPTSMEIDWDAPTAVGSDAQDVTARLGELDRLRHEGAITADEYEAQRKRVLDSI